MSKLVALIPARGGSKGLPNKNTLDLHGRPLIEWSIAFARLHSCIERCIVTTDSPQIAEVARNCGAEVPFLRSNSLSTDHAKTVDVIVDAILRCSLRREDKILLLEPTSPYRTSATFAGLMELFESPKCRKAVSVSEAVSSSHVFQYNVDFGQYPLLRKIDTKTEANGLRRQDIAPAYYLDGSFYISRIGDFMDRPGFLDDSTVAFVSDYFSSFEIDCENDLQLMRGIFQSIGLPF